MVIEPTSHEDMRAINTNRCTVVFRLHFLIGKDKILLCDLAFEQVNGDELINANEVSEWPILS